MTRGSLGAGADGADCTAGVGAGCAGCWITMGRPVAGTGEDCWVIRVGGGTATAGVAAAVCPTILGETGGRGFDLSLTAVGVAAWETAGASGLSCFDAEMGGCAAGLADCVGATPGEAERCVFASFATPPTAPKATTPMATHIAAGRVFFCSTTGTAVGIAVAVCLGVRAGR